MNPADLLKIYDSQLRDEAEVADVDEVVRFGPLWLATMAGRGRGFITYRDLEGVNGPALDDLIQRAIAHFEQDERVSRVEWKTRGHDKPADLVERLESHGFTLEEIETVMMGDAQKVVEMAPDLPPGYTLEKAENEAELRAAEALAGRVFGDSEEASSAMADELVARWKSAPDSLQMWAVRTAKGDVVCSGRVDFVAGTEVAGLWGGACDENHRGQGLYRVLTAERAKSALNREKRYLQSDCTEYSRPILERAGLVKVTTTAPAIWRRAATA